MIQIQCNASVTNFAYNQILKVFVYSFRVDGTTTSRVELELIKSAGGRWGLRGPGERDWE